MSDAKVIRYWSDGFRTGILVHEGTKHAHVVAMDTPIRKIKLLVEDYGQVWDYIDYPAGTKHAAKLLLSAGQRLGITEGARISLEAA